MLPTVTIHPPFLVHRREPPPIFVRVPADESDCAAKFLRGILAFYDFMSGTPMSKSFTTITHDVAKGLGSMRKEIPETIQGFNALAKAALSPGVLSALDKELIALAIGVASRCDACIGFHVKALIRLGVSRAQLMETLAVCTYMGGGPTLMYAAEAVRAYEELNSEQPAPVSA